MLAFLIISITFIIAVVVIRAFGIGLVFAGTIDQNCKIIAKLLNSEVTKPPFIFQLFSLYLQRSITGYYQGREVRCFSFFGKSNTSLSMETHIKPKKKLLQPQQRITEFAVLINNKIYYYYNFIGLWDKSKRYLSLNRIKYTEEELKFFLDEMLKAAKIVETQYPDGIVKGSGNNKAALIIVIVFIVFFLFSVYMAYRQFIGR